MMFVIMIIMLIDDNNQCTGDFGGAGREVSLHPCHRSCEVMLERLLSGYVDVNADLISDCEWAKEMKQLLMTGNQQPISIDQLSKAN